MESQITQGQLELERIFSKYYAKMEEPDGLDEMENQITQSQLEIERIFNKFYSTLERIAKDLDINSQPTAEKPNNSSGNNQDKSAEIIDKKDQQSRDILEELEQRINS